MNVAEAMVQAFVQEGVRVAAGISGGSIRATPIALARQPDVRVIYARHERGATDIADGYGRVTGEPAIVFADAGPAVANTMAGIVQAFGDSTPLIFVASQPDRLTLGRRAFKELAVHDVFSPVTKWTASITDPSQVAEIVRRAFTLLRSGRPGPIVVEVASDVSRMPVENFHYEPVPGCIRSAGDPAEIERAVELLAAAERPYLYVGAGVLMAQATDELVTLAELLSLPVATTLNGKSAFPENHPLSLGLGGFPRAAYSSKHATEYAREADVVLTLSCGFKEPATKGKFSGSFKLIQVDVDPSEIHKLQRADVAIVGDAKLVLQQMIAAAKSLLPPSKLGLRADVARAIAKGRAEWLAFSEPLLRSNEKPINAFRLTWELKQLVDPSQTIVLHDAGSTRGSTCQHYEATTPRGFVGQGVQSALGWSLGAAIGAKLAAPEKLVVAFTGDEAFGETAMELETATRYGVPILVLLNNNGRLPGGGSTASHQDPQREYQGGRGDYCTVARGLGAAAWRIEDPDELAPGLAKAIEMVKGGQTAVVEVVTRFVQPSLSSQW